jgi:hypothetical protein
LIKKKTLSNLRKKKGISVQIKIIPPDNISKLELNFKKFVDDGDLVSF